MILGRHDFESVGNIGNTKLLCWNMDEKQYEETLIIGEGGIIRYNFGSVTNGVLDDGKVIYTQRGNDTPGVEICCYDFLSGDKRSLYVDPCSNVTFRFLGETESDYIGEMVDVDSNWNVTALGVFIITKEDYMAGKLNEARQLNV